MRGVYSDYTGLTAKYGKIIFSLADSLKNQAEYFYSHEVICGRPVSGLVYPANELLIDDVVLNTISDLDRVANYHRVEKTTRYKYAAYVGFWWQRGKPFACKVHDYAALPELADDALDSLFLDMCKSINEIFITDVMLSFIQRPPSRQVCMEAAGLFKYIDIQDSLQYFLKYRQYTAQELELFLKGLDTCPLAG